MKQGCFYKTAAPSAAGSECHPADAVSSCIPRFGLTPPALAPFRTFPLQSAAFDYVDTQPMPLRSELRWKTQRWNKGLELDLTPLPHPCARVFAEELSSTGKRRYLVTTAPKMWTVYGKDCDPSARHHYEIIREGRPCHLYFGESFDFNHRSFSLCGAGTYCLCPLRIALALIL